MMLHIGHQILIVPSVEEALPFWTDGLGFVVSKRFQNSYVELQSSTGQVLALVEAKLMQAILPETSFQMPSHTPKSWQNPLFFSLEVPDLGLTLERIKSYQVQILQAPQAMPWGTTVAFVQEPFSGLCFEIMQNRTYKDSVQ